MTDICRCLLMLCMIAGLVTRVVSAPDDARVLFNHPGLIVDLSVGLWAQPLPMDADADGDIDLYVASKNVPSGGIMYFENRGDGIFKAGRRVSDALHNLTVSQTPDGPLVMSPGKAYPDFLRTQLSNPIEIDYAPDFYAQRFNQWYQVDFDGDGTQDLVIGAMDNRDYGWEDAYDAQGRWRNGPLHGHVFWVRNEGTDAHPKYARAHQVLAGKQPIDVYGTVSPNCIDWDGDGDLDLICGEFIERITCFENVGTRTSPRYAPGKFLTVNGDILRMELTMLQVTSIDWDHDGDPDLLVGEEDGRVALIENLGPDAQGFVAIRPPVYLRQEADALRCGVLATPTSFDWDGDGDADLICGDSAGFINFIENLDGANPPRWAAPVRLHADGKLIRYQAGENLSIQGPCETKWGYTAPHLADWDGDGLPDILVNTIVGRIEWLRNIGSRTEPTLAAAQPVEVEWSGAPPKPAWTWWTPGSRELVVQWRTRPLAVDVDQDGLTDLVAVDHEGYLALYQRAQRGDRRVLLPGARIFRGMPGASVFNHRTEPLFFDLDSNGGNDLALHDADGAAIFKIGRQDALRTSTRTTVTVEMVRALHSPAVADLLRLNGEWSGQSGRRNIEWADWDGDGHPDLIVNSASVHLLRNRGERDAWIFENVGALTPDQLAGHTTSPTIVDWDRDGRPELLVGAEDGCFYHYPQSPR